LTPELWLPQQKWDLNPDFCQVVCRITPKNVVASLIHSLVSVRHLSESREKWPLILQEMLINVLECPILQ